MESRERGTRVTLTARVERLWDDTHPKQHQAGVLADRTGMRTFVFWPADEPSTVVPERWYQFANLRVDGYEGDTRFVLEQETRLTRLDQE